MRTFSSGHKLMPVGLKRVIREVSGHGQHAHRLWGWGIWDGSQAACLVLPTPDCSTRAQKKPGSALRSISCMAKAAPSAELAGTDVLAGLAGEEGTGCWEPRHIFLGF